MNKPATELMNALMAWRARGLMARVVPLFPRGAAVLDVGCGTGHNAERLRRLGLGPVSEVDVVDFKVARPGPILFDGRSLPFADAQFDVVMLIYVLHYAPDPAALLEEARRVCRGALVVMQTVCEGGRGGPFYRGNELISRLGFYAARFFQAIPAVQCPLHSARGFSRSAFLRVTRQAGLIPRAWRAERHFPFLPLTRITCTLARSHPARQ